MSKIKLTRSLRSKKEIKNNTPLYDTKGWEKQKKDKQVKVETRNKNNAERKTIREAEVEKKVKLTKKRLKKQEKAQRVEAKRRRKNFKNEDYVKKLR